MTRKVSHKKKAGRETCPSGKRGRNRGTPRHLSESFKKRCDLYWTNLSHLTSLLIVVNLSMFFVTRLVVDEGYYYTFYSLAALMLVEFFILIPAGLVEKLWFYLICLFFEFIAVYFIVISIWYWIVTNRI